MLIEAEPQESLADLLQAARDSKGAVSTVAWQKYRDRLGAILARLDVQRRLYKAAAIAMGERVGGLPNVVVEYAESDDFGRIELQLTIDGKRYWTRPTDVKDARGYRRIRDAIAAKKREDWQRARVWLAWEKPGRSLVRWNGYEQLRFDRNQYGASFWRR